MVTVRERYRALVAAAAGAAGRQDEEAYQAEVARTLEGLAEVREAVHTLGLFSRNEGVEDVATGTLELLALDWQLARVAARRYRRGADARRWRLRCLEEAVQFAMQFLVGLQDYGVLDEALSKRLDGFEKTFRPRVEEMYPQPQSARDLGGAHLRREAKIAQFRRVRELEAQLDELEARRAAAGADEELERRLWLAQLQQMSYECFGELEGWLMEMELLRNTEPADEPAAAAQATPDSQEYTEKLESLQKPLLSKYGKVLRNFTLVDQRDRVKERVLGYGQYGPTMTVEEFLEQEFESGRVLQGGEEPEEVPDEDNEEWQDKQTYKEREWDEFKEANPRGSGNTMNKG
ncbi:ABR072Wp [Eremothecium gossypii ATCC 10895]|uniref:ABR072Wp n=1 Tax=Eremothecium gossypii (strain ATCC 10895 / CBS 109.51 / FGSC 9923 / NRRL Y-1056) TaxID=284811 RepID=Q75DF4_EREGS|nr:ABR072Wp [Eremothecium gossypii ATCC 10895]AAS50842.2 ABR072Wp [Eremothecium gossypii ATCC 10895]AEY95131.1 FABR072Wp [Eremothecium gossypii FDAG1]